MNWKLKFREFDPERDKKTLPILWAIGVFFLAGGILTAWVMKNLLYGFPSLYTTIFVLREAGKAQRKLKEYSTKIV